MDNEYKVWKFVVGAIVNLSINLLEVAIIGLLQYSTAG
jgi:hypothetical protein